MNAPTKLAAFGLVLVLSFAGGAALGEVVGPVDVGEPQDHPSDTTPVEPGPTSTTAHEGGH
jgi:hypothetical protein